MELERTPLFTGPIRRLAFAGIPYSGAVLYWTLALAVILGFQNLWLVPLAGAGHMALVSIYKIDEYMLDVIIEHIHDEEYLHP